MAQNRFKAFLEEGLPFGDVVDRPFVIDAVSDLNLPDPKSWDELEAHLKDENPDTIEEAKYIWKLYEAHLLGKMD